MNVLLPVQPMDKSAFLAWLERQEDRYELAGGRVMMMVRASRAHAEIVRNLLLILHGQLDIHEWTVLADFGLDIGPKTLRFPDILVDRVGGVASDYTAIAPILAAEILSPSTAAVDLGDKAAEYLRLPSLAAYLVFAQDSRKAWVWVRGPNGFPAGPHVIEGDDSTIAIAALNLTVPLAAVYSGVAAD
jgi:Uma2 family endonuclease